MIDQEYIKITKKFVKKMITPLKSRGYAYHNLDHTLNVLDRSIQLAKKEGVNHQMQQILKLTSLFHDIGHLIQYQNHEKASAQIAQNFFSKNIDYFQNNEDFKHLKNLKELEKIKKLPKYQIQMIQNNILSTKLDYNDPKNILEEIIIDSDVDNFGRKDFFKQNLKLKKEIEELQDQNINKKDWFQSSLELFENQITFYTQTQIQQRKVQFKKNYNKLKSKIKNLK